MGATLEYLQGVLQGHRYWRHRQFSAGCVLIIAGEMRGYMFVYAVSHLPKPSCEQLYVQFVQRSVCS